MAIKVDKKSGTNYGMMHNRNIPFLKDITFLMKLKEIVSVRLNGITEFWISFLFEKLYSAYSTGSSCLPSLLNHSVEKN